MNELQFIWDEDKNQKNIEKHGISFAEARDVFYDDNAVLFDDPDHSVEENRFLIIGMIKSDKECIVSHYYRDNDEVIRIISAREATKGEKDYYYTGMVN